MVNKSKLTRAHTTVCIMLSLCSWKLSFITEKDLDNFCLCLQRSCKLRRKFSLWEAGEQTCCCESMHTTFSVFSVSLTTRYFLFRSLPCTVLGSKNENVEQSGLLLLTHYCFDAVFKPLKEIHMCVIQGLMFSCQQFSRVICSLFSIPVSSALWAT